MHILNNKDIRLQSATLIMMACVLSLSACKDDKESAQTPQSKASQKKPAKDHKMAKQALETTPISMADAFYAGPPRYKPLATCPFLSDETAISSVKKNHPLKRFSVANNRCVWQYNLGYSIIVSVDDAATAKPLKDHYYNMDNPPILKPQSGPGENAGILYDITWDKDKPRPYGFGFSQNGKSIYIHILTYNTDEEKLRRTADEIAKTLPSAKKIKPQELTQIGQIDACNIWSQASLMPLFSKARKDSLETQKNLQSCDYSFTSALNDDGIKVGEYIKINLGFSKASGSECQSANGPDDFKTDKAIVSFYEDTSTFGAGIAHNICLKNGSVRVAISPAKPEYKPQLKRLTKNILSRLSE